MSVAPRLELALRPSRRWAWLLAIALSAVALVCLGLSLPLLARTGLVGALLGVGILAVRNWRWLAGADLLLWDGIGWQLRVRGEYVRLENCRPEYVSSWLIVLSYRAPKRRRPLPLFSDAMTAEGFRQLQVRVRSGVPASASAGSRR